MDFYTNVSRLGNNILVSGYENGEKVYRKDKFSPTLYLKNNSIQNPIFKSIHNESLDSISFETMSEANTFLKEADGTNIDVYGNSNFIYQWIVDQFPNEITGVDSSSLNVCNFDIEVMSDQGFPHPDQAAFPVISIAIYFSATDEYIVLGSKNNLNIDELGYPNLRYEYYEDEVGLLSRFMNLINSHAPDILTGWNIRLFDIPYLIHRIDRLFGEGYSRKLSPWNRINQKSIFIKGNENIAYDITGISQLDYLDIFKKFSQNTYGQLESYRLDNVGFVVLGEKKLDYSEYSNLNELYEQDYQKFIQYNIRDVELVKRIDEQVRYIDIAMMIAFKTGVNFVDTLGTVNAWDTYIYRELLKDNVIVPPSKPKKRQSFEGAYVKEPKSGMCDWIVSFDLASLYPNIIVQYNMSPETIVDREIKNLPNGINSILNDGVRNDKSDYFSMAANGIYFRKNKQGIIAQIMEKVYGERFIIKNQMLEYQKQLENETNPDKKKYLEKQIDISKNSQTAIKIFINSGYGALGSPFFRFYDVRIAEGITLTGQLTTRWAEKTINQYLNSAFKTTDTDYVAYCDTDSAYVNLSKFIKMVNPESPVDALDKFSKNILTPVIDKGYEELLHVMGGYKQRAQMKREKICSKGFWTGKKRYVLNVLDNEGVRYKEPKIAITGIEAIKSSTPAVIRQKLKDSFKIIMEDNQDQMQKFIDDTKAFFMSCTPEQIAFPKGVSNVDKYLDDKKVYKKGTPINSRASILYNKLIEEKKLTHKYYRINSGDKILFVYLRMPNPIHEDVIGFSDILPEEFGLHKYVDYEVQFQKTFLAVLDPIFEKIGWSINKEEGLDDFFS